VTGGGDFGGAALTGTLKFPIGTVSKAFSIPIWPKTSPVGDKSFTITLSSPTGGVTIIRTTGTGTILGNS
jgi:hypothetical protein